MNDTTAFRLRFFAIVLSCFVTTACNQAELPATHKPDHNWPNAVLEYHFFLKPLLQSRIKPLSAKMYATDARVIRLIDASSWGHGITTVELQDLNQGGVSGRIESAGTCAGYREHANRPLNPLEIRTIETCLNEVNKSERPPVVKEPTVPETVTVDNAADLIEIIDKGEYRLILRTSDLLDKDAALSRLLTKINEIALKQ